MGQFGTEVSQMETASQHVATVNSQINTLLSTLRNEAASVGSHWKGAAQTSFTELMSRYDASSQKLNQALQGIGEQIKAAGTTYNTTDETHSSTLKNIGSSLNV